MNLLNFLIDIFSDYTTQVIALGAGALGVISGVLGSYAVLKKQSLIGDAISHAALPGIAVAFLITGTKNTSVLLIGALVAGLIGTVWIDSITSNTRIKNDSALGIILSVFFGFGMMLLTFIQKLPNSNQAGLDKFIFGQAATLLIGDVYLIIIVGVISLVVVYVLWKELKLITFDPQYAITIGYNVKLLDGILMTMIVVAIILGLQTVGVVLMSAMILAPAAAARQWTDKMGKMLFLSALFGALSGLVGTAISSSGAKIATGPTIVLTAVTFVIISFIFAPGRGLLVALLRRKRNQNQIKSDKLLLSLYKMLIKHDDIYHEHSCMIIKKNPQYNSKNYKEIIEKGYIEIKDKCWHITPEGINYAESLGLVEMEEI
jgi:manganese/zinc/iron transport system permease protein